MLLRRLPRLRDRSLDPHEAFAGTFHVNESATQLAVAYASAQRGVVSDLAPCEIYRHSLTDPTILGEELRASGAQTLTCFGLHMPARLFNGDHERAKTEAIQATLASLNSVLAEPIEDCLYTTPGGEPCLEAKTPVELEAELGLGGQHLPSRPRVAVRRARGGRRHLGVETRWDNVLHVRSGRATRGWG